MSTRLPAAHAAAAAAAVAVAVAVGSAADKPVAACRVRCQVPPLFDPLQPPLLPARPARAKRRGRKPAKAWSQLAVQRPLSVAPVTLVAPVTPTLKGMPMGLRRLGAAALGVMYLAGCSMFPANQAAEPTPLRVAPVLRIDSGTMTADAMYAAGKLAMQGGQPQNALMNFEQALLAHPGHADAHNGKVVALARMGRAAEAVAFAESSLAKGIESAELRANVVLLRSWAGQAAVATERTAPPSATKLAAHHETAQTIPEARGASTAPTAPTGPTAPTAPTASTAPTAPTAPPAVAQMQSTLKWMQHGSNVLELSRQDSAALAPTAPIRDVPPVPVAVPLPQAVLSPAPLFSVVALPAATASAGPAAQRSSPPSAALVSDLALEVSNGAGRLNLARVTAHALLTVGVQTRRLTNHVNYRVQKTEIHYRGAAHLAAAQLLAQTLSVDATLIESTMLRREINVRVVMGGDAVGRLAAALPLVRQAPAVVAASLS